MKRLFVLFLCMFLLILPMTAMAAGEDLGDLIGHEVGILATLLVAVTLIAADTLLGIFVAKKNDEFDWIILPQFLATGVLPYIGGLIVLTVLAHFVPLILPPAALPLTGLFYTAALTVAGKYFVDWQEKLKLLFGIKLIQ